MTLTDTHYPARQRIPANPQRSHHFTHRSMGLNEACKQQKLWQKTTGTQFCTGVNLSINLKHHRYQYSPKKQEWSLHLLIWNSLKLQLKLI